MNADPRWRRARAAAAIARGQAAATIRDETGTPIETGVEAVRVLRDGTLVRIRDGALVIGDMPPIALPVHERQMYQQRAAVDRDGDDDRVEGMDLVDACSRSGIDMPLDPAKDERELLRFSHDKPWPWGIPPSHTWWSKKPPPEPEDPNDPRWR